MNSANMTLVADTTENPRTYLGPTLSKITALGFGCVFLFGCGTPADSTSSSSFSSSPPTSSASSSISPTPPMGFEGIVIQENTAGFCTVDGAIENDHTGFSGEGYANSNNASGAQIRWSIHAESAGLYELQLKYANGSGTDRLARFEVNQASTASETVQFSSTEEWNNWQDHPFQVRLEAGNNQFALISESSEGLSNIDFLSIEGTGISAGTCNDEQINESWTTTVPFNISGSDGIHDPSTILKDGDRYWTFGTGFGSGRPINALYSYDLMTWQQGPSPIPANTYPNWINDKLPTFDGNFWAPDIIKMNGRYYLYYSAFSSTVLNSAIGVMVSDSLNNPNWEDLGMVVSTRDDPRSSDNQPVNAIDAGLYRDADDNVWMIYGSHYAGIFIRQINPQTGLLMDNIRYDAAGNRGGWNEYEAAQVQYIDGHYYLFVNLGDCCAQLDSNYIVYVGRSTSPTGPFLTENGHNLWHGDVISQQQVVSGVTTGSVLSSQPGRVGPGHFGYLYNKGQHLASIHYYGGADGWGHLAILEMTFENGWPVFNYDFNLRQ